MSGSPAAEQPEPSPVVLVYPRGSVLLVAGIPGAGKSTLINRVFGPATARLAAVRPARVLRGAARHETARSRSRRRGPEPRAIVLDSASIRAGLARRLGPRTPYPLYRPVVHVLHYLRIAAMTLGPRHSLVVHECGTRDWARRILALLARLRGRPAHLLLLDVPPAHALAGQHERGRTVRRQAFARHERSWQRLCSPGQPGHPLAREGWRSIRRIDRHEAAAIAEIRFEDRPARAAGRADRSDLLARARRRERGRARGRGRGRGGGRGRSDDVQAGGAPGGRPRI